MLRKEKKKKIGRQDMFFIPSTNQNQMFIYNFMKRVVFSYILSLGKADVKNSGYVSSYDGTETGCNQQRQRGREEGVEQRYFLSAFPPYPLGTAWPDDSSCFLLQCYTSHPHPTHTHTHMHLHHHQKECVCAEYQSQQNDAL